MYFLALKNNTQKIIKNDSRIFPRRFQQPNRPPLFIYFVSLSLWSLSHCCLWRKFRFCGTMSQCQKMQRTFQRGCLSRPRCVSIICAIISLSSGRIMAARSIGSQQTVWRIRGWSFLDGTPERHCSPRRQRLMLSSFYFIWPCAACNYPTQQGNAILPLSPCTFLLSLSEASERVHLLLAPFDAKVIKAPSPQSFLCSSNGQMGSPRVHKKQVTLLEKKLSGLSAPKCFE